MLNIAVILGTTRPNRASGPIGKWVMEHAAKKEGWNAELIDLRDWPLPFFNEPQPVMALNGEYSVPLAKEWSKKIAGMDAFIVVTAEYNHGYPAVLKNALDYLYAEWTNKPVAFVAYGNAGGARSVEQLREVVGELQMHDIREAVHVMAPWFAIKDEAFTQGEVYEKKLGMTLSQLDWWAKLLKDGRDGK